MRGARALARYLKSHGITIQSERSGHLGLYKSGARVATAPASPSDVHAYDNTINDLVKRGHLPAAEKGRKF